MDNFLNTPNISTIAVLSILILFGLAETILGNYANTKRSKDDWILEGIGLGVINVSKAIIFFLALIIMSTLAPQLADSLSTLHLIPAFFFYLLLDDLMQYWYHRSAHEYEWLWKHHRVHHAAREMGILTSYRNSFIYYLIMPNIWWAAIASYLGMAPAVILGLIFKQLIVTASHSTFHWDEFLYRHKILSPIAWVLEHILITPAFHHAHHGHSQADHISDPNGNFGNTFSLWDQLFGSAKFTRKFPSKFGLQNDPKDNWSAHLLYPVIKSKKENSEIGHGFKKVKHTHNEPLKTTLKEGTYLYCQCGFSNNQPWCNGAHHGTKFKPMVVDITKERKASICTCKLTKSPPYCDNSHESLT